MTETCLQPNGTYLQGNSKRDVIACALLFLGLVLVTALRVVPRYRARSALCRQG
jgi:hypothetical protein